MICQPCPGSRARRAQASVAESKVSTPRLRLVWLQKLLVLSSLGLGCSNREPVASENPAMSSLTVRFGTERASRMQTSGWGRPEKIDGRSVQWSEGAKSSLRFSLAPKDAPYRLSGYVSPIGQLAEQTISVTANGVPVGDVTIRPGKQWFHLTVARPSLKRGSNTLEFGYRYLIRPSQHGVGSTDIRRLAILWDELTLTPVAHSTTVDMGDKSARPFELDGWSSNERWGDRTVAWSDGPTSAINVVVDPVEQSYRLLVSARTELGPMAVPVFVGTNAIGSLPVDQQMKVHELAVPKGQLQPGSNALRFRYPRTFQPAALDGASNDQRLLGMMIDKVGVLPETSFVTIDAGSSEHRAALVSGWGADETVDGRSVAWSLGKESSISFSLNPTSTPYQLIVDALAIVRSQPHLVEVSINGKPAGTLTFSRTEWQEARSSIPAGVLQAGTNTIGLHYALTVKPSDEDGNSSDDRELAMMLDRLQLRPSFE